MPRKRRSGTLNEAQLMCSPLKIKSKGIDFEALEKNIMLFLNAEGINKILPSGDDIKESNIIKKHSSLKLSPVKRNSILLRRE